MHCTRCNSEKTYKNGLKHGKQRYFCRECKRQFSENDSRIKRDFKQREMVMLLYLYNNSLRSIEKVINKFFDTNINVSLIYHWTQNFAKNLRLELKEEKIKIQESQPPKTIEILEIDELYSYFYDFKKNAKSKLKYGLLLTETEAKLLRMR